MSRLKLPVFLGGGQTVLIKDREWVSVASNELTRLAEDAIPLLAKTRGLIIEKGEVVAPMYEEAFHDAGEIPDFLSAIERIISAKEKSERVAIYGDYDVDGVTSAAILAETFEKIGIKTEVFLPHREDDGYGLNLPAVEKIATVADLLVTIDNGTSAIQAIDYARDRGLEVVVIDHHVVPDKLPRALVVNPHRPDSKYPFPDLCAAGLAFKFARSLLARFDREDEAKWLLDLAALGTIADRVPLQSENRNIVIFGLKVLAVTRRLGLVALMARSGIFKNNLDSENLAFKIIPRLNAAGRMQHADLAYALLRTKDHVEAEKLSIELDGLNNNRRTITASALKEIKETISERKASSEALFVAGEWPVGILGILAGKLADEYGLPSAVINIGDETCTGSIRGNGLVDIVKILSGTEKILTKYGGHFTAGGFSFEKKDLEKLSRYFDGLKIGSADLVRDISYDLEISPSLIEPDFLEQLKKLEPHGQENNRPVFLIKNLEIRELRAIGTAKDHKRFIFGHPEFASGTIAGVAFNWKKGEELGIGQKADVLCELKINEFRGKSTVDLMVVDIRLAA